MPSAPAVLNHSLKQIFVSRLILNSEGKYFIDNIMPEEKAKLSEIVYNIVILIPTNNQKGEPADKLLSSLTEKYALLLSNDVPTLGEQEYYNNCSIAITSKELVGLAEVFYNTNLKVEEPVLKASAVPTWEIPSSNEVVQPVEQAVNTVPIFTSAENENTSSPEVKAEEPMVNETPAVEPIPPVVNNNSQATNVIPNTTEEMPANTLNNNLANNSINNNVNNVLPENNMPNPQAEKLAIVSDPSLASIIYSIDEELGKRMDQIRLLSFGTGYCYNSIKEDTSKWGAIDWVISKDPDLPIISVTLEGNAQLSQIFSKKLLDSNYYRVNPKMDKDISMDDTKSMDYLLELAAAYTIKDCINWINNKWNKI